VTAPAPAAVVDTVLWPLLETLRTSLATQLGAVRRPVCEMPIYTGGTAMPADRCDCTCDNGGQGAAWIRMVNATSVLPGVASKLQGTPMVGAELSITIELGVYRCAPMLDATAPVPAAPTAQAYDTHSKGRILDALAIHRALLCSEQLQRRDLRWSLVSLGAQGPDGGCDAMVGLIQVTVTDCCPLVLVTDWRPHPDDPLSVMVDVSGQGSNGAAISWGDGHTTHPVTAAAPAIHTYAQPGTYTAVVADIGEPSAQVQLRIVVKEQSPTAHVFASGDDPWSALLWLDEPEDNGVEYRLSWGDGSPVTTVTGHRPATSDPGSAPTSLLSHLYRALDLYRVQVTDPESRRVTTLMFDTGDPGVAVLPSGDPARPLLSVWSLRAGTPIEVDQHDGEPPLQATSDPSGRAELQLRALDPGGQDVTVSELVPNPDDVDGDPVVRRYTTVQVRTPVDPSGDLPVELAWRTLQYDPMRPNDTYRQKITVTVPDADVPCRVDWGETPIVDLDPGGSVSHRFLVPPTQPPGYELTVAEDDGEITRMYTRLLAAPVYVGVPVLVHGPDIDEGLVQLSVVGQDAGGADVYRISWGDGQVDDPTTNSRSSWVPALHTYAEPGVYEITVDGPGMPAPVTRQVTVVTVPSAGVAQ
jgi:hypothetical protein